MGNSIDTRDIVNQTTKENIYNVYKGICGQEKDLILFPALAYSISKERLRNKSLHLLLAICSVSQYNDVIIAMEERRQGVMIYITGDTHGDFRRIFDFCMRLKTSMDDIMVILGDAGINFGGGFKDQAKKDYIAAMPITLFVYMVIMNKDHLQFPRMRKESGMVA